MTPQPLPYSPELEQVGPDEAETQHALIETFRGIIETVHGDHGRAFRSVHAKSHALLEGELTVLDGLPLGYAQGAFAVPRSYPVLIRISTNPGDPLPDSISVPRGFAIKLIGVEGERMEGSEGDATQDFVLANGKVFAAPDPKKFLANLKLLAATTDKAEWGKKAISAVFRTIEKGLEAVGAESAKLQQMGGHANTHPLGESFFSQAPLRWGDHVAKVGVVPYSPNLKALTGEEITIGGRENALREDVAQFFDTEGGEWEFRVQLRVDAECNPIEDATVEWPEDDNPYVAVARIRVAPQRSWSFERAAVVDDATSFSPWHGIAAHRPLGAIMRARKPAYAASADLRGQLNGCPIHEPREAPALA